MGFNFQLNNLVGFSKYECIILNWMRIVQRLTRALINKKNKEH